MNRGLLLLVFGALLVVLIVAFANLYRSTRTQLEARFLQSQEEALRATLSVPLQQQVDLATSFISKLASQPEVRQAARGQSGERMEPLLIDILARETRLLRLEVFDGEGRLVAALARRGLDAEDLAASWYAAPMSERRAQVLTGVDARFVNEGAEPRLALVAPVESPERRGAPGRISLDWAVGDGLPDAAKTRSRILGEVVLLDERGRALAGAAEIPLDREAVEAVSRSVGAASLVTADRYLSVVPVRVPGRGFWRHVAMPTRDEVEPRLGGDLNVTIGLAVAAMALVLILGWYATQVQMREVSAQERAKGLQHTLDVKARSERFLNDVFDAITDVIVIQDTDYNIIRTNRVAREVYGGDINGRKCYSVYRDKDTPDCQDCPIEATIGKGQPHSTEMVDPRSGEVWQINNFPLRDPSGEITMVIEHARNITERRALESKLIQSEKLSTLGEMAAGIAHEINNPVGVVSMFAQLAAEGLRADEARGELLEKIEVIDEHSQQIGRIVKDLLQFARKSEGDRAVVEVSRIFDRAIAIVELQKMARTVEITRDSGEGVQLFADEGQLAQVVLNLVVNAIHAMDGQGKVELRVRRVSAGETLPEGIAVAEAGDDLRGRPRVRISVSDSGPGIAPDTVRKIFDPFFTTKEQGQGTGLGLSVSFGIIRDHGGMIFVESTPGRGATFTLELPAGSERLGAPSQRLRSIDV